MSDMQKAVKEEKKARETRDLIPEVLEELKTTHEDARTAIVKEWDEREEEFLHSWVSAQRDAYHLNRMQMTVVKVDGKPIPFKGDMLVRIPKEKVLKDRLRGELKSRENVKKTLLVDENTDPALEKRSARVLDKHASPRRPPSEEELSELGFGPDDKQGE